MRELVYVDTETTGLRDTDKLVELAYATENSEIKTLYFGVQVVPDFIDELIGFTKRGIAGKKSSTQEIFDFLEVGKGNTMVAANPSFDAGFLRRANLFPFHHRMLDIESYAMGVMGFDEMPGMSDIRRTLTDVYGYDIPKNKHTAASDVAALRASYVVLRDKWHD